MSDIAVYGIRCLINSRIYIGSTTYVKSRLAAHRWNLNNGHHHSSELQLDWKEYGENAFEFVVLRSGNTKPEIDRLERELIVEYGKHVQLYNKQLTKITNNDSAAWMDLMNDLQAACEKEDETINDFARQHKIHTSTIWRWKNGVSGPNYQNILIIKKYIETAFSPLINAHDDADATVLALLREAKEKGLSIRKIANLSGVGYATVHRWKSGTQKPYPLLLDAFARVIREYGESK